MNAMMSVSHRLFAAALADNSEARRPVPRSEKQVVIELARREAASVWSKARPSLAQPMAPREIRLDSRLNA